MNTFAALTAGVALTLLAGGASAQPTEPAADRDTPRDQRWLAQLVGEWDAEWKMYMEPDQPPMVAHGADSVQALGDNWVIAHTESVMMGVPFKGMLSLGYDAQRERFHGTWIDSFGGTLWVYEGELNEAGDTLTLETEGPSLEAPGETARYREVMKITGEGSRAFHSSYESQDGVWVRLVEVEYRRRAGNAQARHDQPATDAEGAMRVHYLEIVTAETDATCDVLGQAQGVTFSEPAAELGNARTAPTRGGSRIGVRAPIGPEQPVARPYMLVDDIKAVVKAAEAAGAEILMPPTEIPGQGTFAIYYLGKVEHGLWQNP